MARRYARDPQIDRSLRHSIRDGVAASVQSGSGENYFNAFAVHLKASAGQIALLAALPPLIGSVAQLLSAWFGHRYGGRRHVILFGVRLQAMTWPFLLFLPLLFPEHAVTLFLCSAVVYYAAAALVSPHWSSLMGDLVPERKRGRYFAFRSRLGGMTLFAALVSAGLVLHAFDDAGAAYAGFITIFSLAAVGRMVSIWHLGKMEEPPASKPVPDLRIETAWWQRMRRSPLARFSLFFASMQFSVAIASPFFALYMLRDLHFTYLQFMTNSAASVLMQFLSLSVWGRLGDQFGNRFVLGITGFLIPLLPALWLVSEQQGYLIAVQAFGGAIWAGFSLAATNYLYDLVPSHKRIAYTAYHNVLANSGIFGGALCGGWLAVSFPVNIHLGASGFVLPSALLGVFLVSSLARFGAAVIFLPRLREVRVARPVAFGSVISTGMVPLKLMVFDITMRLRAIGLLER